MSDTALFCFKQARVWNRYEIIKRPYNISLLKNISVFTECVDSLHMIKHCIWAWCAVNCLIFARVLVLLMFTDVLVYGFKNSSNIWLMRAYQYFQLETKNH